MPRFAKSVMMAAIAYANEHSDKEAARQFKVQEPTVRSWRTKLSKDIAKGRNYVTEEPSKVLEKDLSRWVVNRLNGGRRPTLAEISWKGLTIARQVGAKEFAPTPHWASVFLKKVKLYIVWRRSLRNEKRKCSSFKGKLHDGIKNKGFNVSKVKKSPTASVQVHGYVDSFNRCIDQLTAWLRQKLEKNERPTLREISKKGLEIRKSNSGLEFVPSVQWALQFIKMKGLYHKWRASLDEEMSGFENSKQILKNWILERMVQNSCPSLAEISQKAMETALHEGDELSVESDAWSEHFLQYVGLMEQWQTALNVKTTPDIEIKEEFPEKPSELMNERTVLLDEAVKYAELHGNQMAIAKFNITAESFYEYLVGGCEGIPESDTETVSPNLSGLKVAAAGDPSFEQNMDNINISATASEEMESVEQNPISFEYNNNQSLLPSCELSSNNQTPSHEVNGEHENQKLWDIEGFPSELEDDTPADFVKAKDQTPQNNFDSNSSTIALDLEEKTSDYIQNDLDSLLKEKKGCARHSSRFKARQKQEFLAEAEYHRKMFHICKAMSEGRTLPTSKLPEKPKFIAYKKLKEQMLKEQVFVKEREAHLLLYQHLDKNFQPNFDTQRIEKDTVTEVLRLYRQAKIHSSLPYYAAIGGILKQARGDYDCYDSISSTMNWTYAYMHSIIKIHSLCEKYPIFKYLRVGMAIFVRCMPRIKTIMKIQECRNAWREASRKRGLHFPSSHNAHDGFFDGMVAAPLPPTSS